jgi:hypothetical protein
VVQNLKNRLNEICAEVFTTFSARREVDPNANPVTCAEEAIFETFWDMYGARDFMLFMNIGVEFVNEAFDKTESVILM